MRSVLLQFVWWTTSSSSLECVCDPWRLPATNLSRTLFLSSMYSQSRDLTKTKCVCARYYLRDLKTRWIFKRSKSTEYQLNTREWWQEKKMGRMDTWWPSTSPTLEISQSSGDSSLKASKRVVPGVKSAFSHRMWRRLLMNSVWRMVFLKAESLQLPELPSSTILEQ